MRPAPGAARAARYSCAPPLQPRPISSRADTALPTATGAASAWLFAATIFCSAFLLARHLAETTYWMLTKREPYRDPRRPQAVHQGQRDAAASIGMTRAQTMRHVILPQAIGVVLPPMGNYSVSLLKETSVASIISAPELMLRARDLSSEYYMPMQMYLIVALMYLVMAFPLSRLVRYLEFWTSRGR